VKKRWFAAAKAVVLLVMSGCMVGPDYWRPPVTAPDAFRGSSAATAFDAQSIAELKWFEVFKDEQLQELIRTALAQNYDLRDAIARVDTARANLGITQADQYPNFGAGADVTAIEASRRGEQTIPRGTDRQRNFGTVYLSFFPYEVDIWVRLRRATEAARAELLAADWNRRTVITTLVSDVATAYFTLLELDMELSIAKNTLATREETLRVIKIQQQGGAATLLDVRQREQLVYGATESILNAERQIEQTENRISLLLGRNPGPVTRTRLLTEQLTPPEVPAGLPSSLLERRPDIQAGEQVLIAANANIGVVKAAYFPRITLTGEFGFQSTDLSN
jgi:multidrug efflux system outer membrane protein